MVSLLLIVPEQAQGSVAVNDRELYFVQTPCTLLARGCHQILVDHPESVKNVTPDRSKNEHLKGTQLARSPATSVLSPRFNGCFRQRSTTKHTSESGDSGNRCRSHLKVLNRGEMRLVPKLRDSLKN